MRKFLLVMVLLLCFPSALFAEQPPSIYLNGKQLDTQNPPVIENDRVLVPLRVIFEALDQRVSWNMDDQSITSGNIWLQIGNPLAKVGGREITIDTPAVIFDERTYIPLRFIAESLGKRVIWDSGNNKIDINDDTYRLKVKATQSIIESNYNGYDRITNEILSLWYNSLKRTDKSSEVDFDKSMIPFEYSKIYSNLNIREKDITDSLSSLSHPDNDNQEVYNTITAYYKTYSELKNLATSPSGSYDYYSHAVRDAENRFSTIKTKLDAY